MERISSNEVPKGMFETVMTVENYINNSSLSMQLLELIRYRASILNGCAYCVDMHAKELKHTGETETRIHAIGIWKSTPYFTKKEQAVFAFTDALTLLNTEPIAAQLFTELNVYFNKEEISHLTLSIAQINTWNRLMKSFEFTPGNYEIAENKH